MKQRGLLSNVDGGAIQIARAADNKLFQAVCANPLHVQSSLFPSAKIQYTYNLRAGVHNYTLPIKDKKNFIPRLLFTKIY